MTTEEKAKLTDLKKCDFAEMSEYFKAQSEARKAMTKEEKLVSYCICFIKTKSDQVCLIKTTDETAIVGHPISMLQEDCYPVFYIVVYY